MRSLEGNSKPLLMRDNMDDKLFPGFNKLELMDACMNALREEEQGPQGLEQGQQAGSSQRQTVEFSGPPLGPVNRGFLADPMRPFFPSCERMASLARDGAQEYGNRPQNISTIDSSGDETFATELLSPVDTDIYGMGDQTQASNWNIQQTDFAANVAQQGRHLVANRSIGTKCNTPATPPHEQCTRSGRRFLSTETMESSSQCLHRRVDSAYGSYRALNFIEGRDTTRERAACGSNYSLIGGNKALVRSADKQDRARNLDIERIQNPEMSPASGVLNEIEMAVSMAQSRFKSDLVLPSNNNSYVSSHDEITPTFSSCQRDVAHGDRPSSHTATINQAPAYRADVSPTATKDYASRYSCSISDRWKRKSFCQSTSAPIHKPKRGFGQAQIGNYNTGAVDYSPTESGEIYQPSDSVPNRGFSSTSASLESAVISAGTLHQSVGTKINSVNDERANSYATRSSPIQDQSSIEKPVWPHLERRQCLTANRPGDRSRTVSDIEDKPVNLSLQQTKVSPVNVIPPNKLGKASEFRRYTSSFTRQKPYQYPKRRTKSQCSPKNTSPVGPSDFLQDYINQATCTGEQGVAFDMVGTANRTDLENFKDSSFAGVPGSSGDANLGSLFSTCEASHMMVQDDMKTYAVLSGRRTEDIMNPQELSGPSAAQHQQALFQQARHSHSIINYAGPHGHSSDLRSSELSPSPPVRDLRTTATASLPGIMPQTKTYSNVIVAHRQHHSPSPSHHDDYQTQESFQRQFEHPSIFDLQDSRQLHHHQQQSPLSHVHRPGTSFAPLLSPQQQHQQASQYLAAKQQQQRREYFENISSHSGLATVGSMTQYTGTLQPSQIPHGTYLKPPPVDLDELSEDERERMRVKRERNRVAAAKCRNRRRELLERLEKEAEQLEREQELLRENVRRLRVQKLQLGNMLEEHEPTCNKTLVQEEENKTPAEGEPSTSQDEQHLPIPAIREGGEKNESPAANTPSPLQLTTQA